MTKIEIIGSRRALEPTLVCLQSQGCVQLIDASSHPGLALAALPPSEAELSEGAQLRRLRTRLDALIALGYVPTEPPVRAPVELSAVTEELDELTPRLTPLVTRIDDLEAEQSTLPRHIESLRRLVPLVPQLPDLAAYETVALLIDRRHAAVVGWLRSELTTLLGTHFDIISDEVDPDTVGAVLVFPRDQSRGVHALLSEQQVSRVHLPDQYRTMSLSAAIASMEQRMLELPGEIGDTRTALTELLAPRTHWHQARSLIDRRLARLDARRSVGATARAFAVLGWTPQRNLDALADALASEVGAEVLLAELDRSEGEDAPVLLTNRRIARPFQLFLGMLALPRYDTFDPTVLMAIFMPFFFGLMLGDVAYGLILFGLTTWVHRRWGGRSPVVADLTRVLSMGAVWAMVWGVVYGEVFGDLGRRLVDLEPLWLDREEAIEPLLLLAVGVGAAHVTLGLILGIWIAARQADRGKVSERFALLAALAALFAIAGAAAEWLPAGVITPSVGVVILALVALIALRWPLGLVMGPLDLIGTVSNVLSYLRIAAIGLASVFLARVANELGASAPLALGLIIAALFHALNLALGTFSPTIQALRLHYVEFFDKFYEPGGEAFHPFGVEGISVPETAEQPLINA